MRVRGICLSHVGWFFVFLVRRRRAVFFFRLSPFSGVWHPALLGLNCRRFLAGQFFLSVDVCCWAFMSRVPCASMGFGFEDCVFH